MPLFGGVVVECAGEAGNEVKYESVASLALSIIHLSYG